jgi:hypothetical protein
VGDRFAGYTYARADEALEVVRSELTEQGISKRELRASTFCDTCLAGKRQAFVDAVNLGTSLIIGFGHPTAKVVWPGYFLYEWTFNWQGRLTKPQTAVALLPGCYIAGEQFNDPHDPCQPTPCETPTHLKKGLFAPSSGTTLAFATGHMNGGFGGQHELWLEILTLAWGDAPIGTPWPMIVWDAKYRAEAQYPFLADYVRSVGSLGTAVKKNPPVTTDVMVETERVPKETALRVLATGKTHPTLELALPRTDHATLALYDVRGRLVVEIYSSPTTAGLHRVTWNGRDGHGELVRSGVYFARLFTKTSGVASAKVLVLR